MKQTINEQARELRRKRRLRRRWGKVLGILACVVVFCTTYALILPAITLENDTTCGMAEHSHDDDACYTVNVICGQEEHPPVVDMVRDCNLQEGDGAHTHTDDCYQWVEQLTCGMEESETHTHGSECYTMERGEQICPLEEQSGHVHTEACDVPATLDPGHTHDETCCEKVLTCTIPEHTHTPECNIQEPQGHTFSSGNLFTVAFGDIAVNVEAPAEAFPETTTMQVTNAPNEAIQAVADAIGVEASQVKAVDISFYDAQGNEIQPAVPISVKLTANLVAKAEEPVVVHVDDEAGVTVIDQTEVDDKTISFEADSFSVYAITDPSVTRYTFKFYSSDGVSDTAYETQIVKVGEALVQPSTPDTAENYASFDGWYIGGSYTTDDDSTLIWSGGIKLEFGAPLTADRLSELDTASYYDGAGEEQAGEEDHVIQVWARYSVAYEVIFYDHLPVTDPDDPDPGILSPSIVTTRSVAAGATLNLGGITAEPRENGQVFAGWVDAEGKSVGNSITVTGDTYLYATFATGYSLVFDANANDATVTATQYVLEGATPSAPDNPSRPGYTFAGWYTAADGGQVFNFGQELTEDTTVYAHWAPATTTYTVIIWHQSIDDDKDATDAEKTYDYETYYTASASTGATITSSMVTGAQVTENGSTSTVNCTTLDYEGFHYSTKTWDSEDEAIAADGSTIINVYYDRDSITFTFLGLGNDVVYTQSSAIDRYGMYGLVDGEYVILTRNGTNGQNWSYADDAGETHTYTGTRYTVSNGTVMSGLYGQTLAQNNYTWPTTNNAGQAVNWAYSTSGNGQLTNFMETFLPLNGENEVTFTATNALGKTIYYYLQNVDGSYPDTPNETIRLSAENSNFNIGDKYTGFHAASYQIDDGAEVTLNGKIGDTDPNSSYANYYAHIDHDAIDNSVTVYYARNTYYITYYNGEYTSEEDYPVLYGADLSAYKPTEENGGLNPENVPCPHKDEEEYYTLKGWFANQEGTVAFNWDRTMPANNLMVYAVWEPNTYTVTFDAAGGTLTDAQGNTTDKLEVSVAYKDRVSALPISPNLKDHVFLGWTYTYTNEDGEEVEAAWNFGTPITSDVTLTAKYYSESTLVLRYSVDGNVMQITDGNIYQDGANAIITNQIPSGRFIGWKLANDPDGTIYTAGGTIVVDTAHDMLDGSTDTVVTLTAVYDELPVTSITFNPNGGAFPVSQGAGEDGNYVVTDLLNNGGVDLDAIADPIRMGYTFLGWATTFDATTAAFTKGGDSSEDIFADNVGTNLLYAVWDPWLTLNLTKVDSADSSITLEGAQFTLSTTEDGQTYYFHNEGGTPSWSTLHEGETAADYAFTTNGSGSIAFTQALGKGQAYTLTEIQAPEGYNLLTETVIITVTADGTVTASSGNTVTTNVDGSSTVTVQNTAGTTLPNTGGTGTTFYTISGLLLVTAAGMYGYTMRRKRERRAAE